MKDTRGNDLAVGQTVAITRFSEILIGKLIKIRPRNDWYGRYMRGDDPDRQPNTLWDTATTERYSSWYHVECEDMVRKIGDSHNILGITD